LCRVSQFFAGTILGVIKPVEGIDQDSSTGQQSEVGIEIITNGYDAVANLDFALVQKEHQLARITWKCWTKSDEHPLARASELSLADVLPRSTTYQPE